MKMNLDSRSKKILAGTAAVFAFGAVLAAVSPTPDAVSEVDAISVDADDGIGDGAGPPPVIEEPVLEEPVIEEPATEPVEPEATPEPEPEQEPVTLTPASMMRMATPLLMADAGHPMSALGEYAWSNVDDATFDGVGEPLCDSVSIIGLELTALALYDDVAAMLPTFGIDPTPAAIGGMVGAFAGAYCPDGI